MVGWRAEGPTAIVCSFPMSAVGPWQIPALATAMSAYEGEADAANDRRAMSADGAKLTTRTDAGTPVIF